jgi:hypothetical protein
VATIREAIEIKSRPENVFALISDLCRRARLNPSWTMVACEALDGGPLRVGARYRFVTRRGDIRVEHRSRVAEYEPPRRLRLRSEVHPDLEILLAVQPSGGGCILSHTETFRTPPVPPELARQQQPDSTVTAITDLLLLETGGFSMPEPDAWQDTFRKQVQIEIRAWLESIRNEVERETFEE